MAQKTLRTRVTETWNDRFRGTLGQRVQVGKVSDLMNWFSKRITRPALKSVDYTRNDYDLFKAIYYASTINGRGSDYLLAAPFGKNIINSLASFTIGQGFKFELADSEDAQQDLNDWLKDNQSMILDFVKYGLRDGDGYLFMDEFGKISLLDAGTVEARTDPVTGVVVGYDVSEMVTEKLPNSDQTEEYIYLKQFRMDSTQIIKYRANDTKGIENAEVLYRRVFFSEGDTIQEVIDGQFQITSDGNPLSELEIRPLPIVHYANDLEPRNIYGNSEYQNLLMLFLQYHAVLDQAVKNNIFNNNPYLVIKGAQDPIALAKQSNKDKWDFPDSDSDSDKQLNLEAGSVIYTQGDGGAEYVTSPGVMDDTNKLLGTLFNLIVQGSETPEFIFGAAVASSKASTESQLPAFVKKAERKRAQLEEVLTDLGDLYVFRQKELSNTVYLSLPADLKLVLDWPAILDDDKRVDTDIVKLLLDEGILSDAKALEILLPDKIKDTAAEIKAAKSDNKARANATQSTPTQSDRLLTELLAQNKGTPTPQPNPPAQPPAGG